VSVIGNSRAGRDGVQDQFRTLIRQVHDLIGRVDHDRLNRRPRPDAWSVGECVDHLNETARLYLPELTEAIEEARAEGLLATPGAGERTLFGRLLTWGTEPPPRIRTRTFGAIEPAREHDADDLAEAFEALHEEIIVRINEAADLDRKKIRIRSVLDRRIKLSLGDWFHFLAAHGRRHVWQAERALEALNENS
jgi:uncharacterized damage-inducible protein DinB